MILETTVVKKYVKRYLFGLIATTPFQPLFRILHRLSTWGMNIGLGGGVEDSGEGMSLVKFSQTLEPNQTPIIFDIGANQGQFAQVVLRLFGQRVDLYCFEPSVNTFNILKKTLSQFSSVHLYNFGMGNQDAEVTLYLDQPGSGCASVYDRQMPSSVMTLTESIRLKTLDQFCAEKQIEQIHYLKLDVEGHELSVLQGATKLLATDAIDWIQFEFGGCNIDSRTYLRDFFDLLSNQYHIYRILRDGFAPLDRYHETLEIFTTTNFIAKSKRLL
jgi:FkbM family methyltransferase